MFCQICSFYESDNTMIEYTCGHSFHRRCLLPNKLSLITPKCKICVDGVFLNENSEDYECNSGEMAPRERSDSEYSDIWDEVNEYRDISATCVGFLGVLSFISIVLLLI